MAKTKISKAVIFRTLADILGDSPAEAKSNLYRLEDEYRFVTGDIMAFQVLKEAIRLAEIVADDMRQQNPGAKETKPRHRKRNIASVRWHTALKAVFGLTPFPTTVLTRRQYSMFQVTDLQNQALTVKKAINAQLRQKHTYLYGLLAYDITVRNRGGHVRVFRLALFLDWSVVKDIDATLDVRGAVYLKQLMKLLAVFLNGIRHHKGLGHPEGYHWLVLSDHSLRPYVRLHLYVPHQHYRADMLQSIIDRWLRVSPGNVCLEHPHIDLLKTLRFTDPVTHPAARRDNRLFGSEEKITMHAVLAEKKMLSLEEKAVLENEAELRLLAKRIMSYPRIRSYHFSEEGWIKDKDIIRRNTSRRAISNK
jgi:hypothetical protein